MAHLKSLFAAQDMTIGKPWINILKFAIPMLIGNFAQQLYSTVDSIVVGKYVGDNALAAVGNSFPVLNLLLVLFVGISTGVSIMVSQYFGANQKYELSKSVGVSISLTVIASLIIMIIGPLVTTPLMHLLQTPQEVFQMCVDYLVISFVEVLGCSFYNIFSGVLRGLGDAFSSLVFLLIATGLNIGLDILFVASFHLGVAGVAYATIISQFISAVLCMVKIISMRDIVEVKKSYLKLDRFFSLKLIRLGIPSGISQGIFAMASLVVQSLTNSFGATVMACCVVVMRVDGFAMMPNFTFGNAMTTYTGQNVGARKIDRIIQGTRQGTILSMAFSTICTIGILCFGRQLMQLFTDTPELIDMGMHMMSIIAVGYIAMAASQSLQGVLRGAGDTVTPMIIGFICTIVIRVPLAYLLNYLTNSPDCLYWSLLISWIIGTALSVIAFKYGKWKKKAASFGTDIPD